MWDVLRQARLEPMIRSLPDGLETVVGERGYRLSGGERQRLTIARLLINQPRVVILDEATAALDSTNEAAVQAALGEALEGRTAVVIAHRLSTIRAADVILVVEDGRIVERGTHTELLAAEGRYAELYRTQFAEAMPRGTGSRSGVLAPIPTSGPLRGRAGRGPSAGVPDRRAAGASRSSQRISAISAEGCALQVPGAVNTVASMSVAASLAASASQTPMGWRSSGATSMPTSSSSSREAAWAAVSPGSGLPPGCMNLSVPRLRTVSRRPARS